MYSDMSGIISSSCANISKFHRKDKDLSLPSLILQFSLFTRLMSMILGNGLSARSLDQTLIQKPWPRPGLAQLELKDSGSEILQRPQCPPGKSHQGGLDTNVKISVYKDA